MKIQRPWRSKDCVPYLLKKDSLTKFFQRRLDQGSANVMVTGMPNIGKSESTLELCRQICPQFNFKDDLIMTLDQFWDKIDAGKDRPYSCKLCDDFASELNSKDFAKKEVKDIIDYLTTARTDHLMICITTLYDAFLVKDYRTKICDFYVEMRKQNQHPPYVQGVIHYQKREGFKYSLTLNNKERINNSFVGLKFWSWIFYPPPEEIHQEYMLLRIAKNELNKEKGREASERSRQINSSDKQIVDNVLANPGPYIKILKNKKKVFNSALFSADTDISRRRLEKVIAKIKYALSEEAIT